MVKEQKDLNILILGQVSLLKEYYDVKYSIIYINNK
jgi:hypothetical protein